ncbi:MAG: nicotinate-nicotinamide nucleotide adenylyltransferase [Candidatus Melainabacteria bacterium]|nr:nicotinate-nicotinamide nucleotide adenylyltransferase [Candidatus Melainabacteria bacterium]
MKHIGILGGTFDIVHNGHVDVANFVAKQLGLDKVLLVTAGKPPHKQSGVLDSEVRHELVEGAVEGNPGLEASRIELDLPGLSYTYRTVMQLSELLSEQSSGNVSITFILSAEYLDPANPSNVTTWDEADAFLAKVQLAVVPRGKYTAELARQWVEELKLTNVRIFDQQISSLSSGIVRDAIKNGLAIDDLVPPRVVELVKKHGIIYS